MGGLGSYFSVQCNQQCKIKAMLIEKVNKPPITGKNISNFSLFLGTELGVGGTAHLPLQQPASGGSDRLHLHNGP